MDPWVIWLVLAAGLAVVEVLTGTLVLGLLAGAAVLAAGADLIGFPVWAQVLVFAGAGTALTLTVRPIARRHMEPSPGMLTGVAALAGRGALVTAAIDRTGGRVKLGGESWAARALDPTMTLAAGTHVTVAEVDGATLVVYQSELT